MSEVITVYSDNILNEKTKLQSVSILIDSDESVSVQKGNILPEKTKLQSVSILIDSDESVSVQKGNILPVAEISREFIEYPSPLEMWRDTNTGKPLKNIKFKALVGIDYEAIDDDTQYSYSIMLNKDTIQTGYIIANEEKEVIIDTSEWSERNNTLDIILAGERIVENEGVIIYDESDIDLAPMLSEITPSETFEGIDNNVYLRDELIINNTGIFPGNISFKIDIDDLKLGENNLKIEFEE